MGEGWLMMMPKGGDDPYVAADVTLADVQALHAEIEAVDDSVVGFHWADWP